jgi:DNA-binding protein HU-beta
MNKHGLTQFVAKAT